MTTKMPNICKVLERCLTQNKCHTSVLSNNTFLNPMPVHSTPTPLKQMRLASLDVCEIPGADS